MAKRPIAIVALVLAIVAGVWFAVSDESASAPAAGVAAVASSQTAEHAKRVAAADTPPEPADESAAAERVPPIRGFVHAIGGGPIEGALVELVRPRDATGRTVLATTRTDAAGKFTLEAERWNPDASVAACASGCARATAQAAPGGSVDLALAVGGVLRGRVFDERTGAPLPGALIRVAAADGALQEFEDRTVTAADGAYEFAHVLPWTIGVAAVAPGRPVESGRVEVQPGATTTLDIPVARGGVVTGRVTRAGRPVGGARVSLWNGFDGAPVVTGDDGGFTLTGFAGDLSVGGEAVVVTADGPMYGYVRLPTKPSSEVHADVDLTNAWTIRGVVKTGGVPVARARVERASWLGSYGGWRHLIEARDDGTFEIAADEFDPCEIAAESPDATVHVAARVPRPRTGTVADGVVVDLPAAVELRARVVAAGDGAPVAGATVSIPYHGSPALSDEAGVVRMRMAPPGACTVYVWARGFGVAGRAANVVAGAAGDLGDIAIARVASGFVAGHARTPDGAPLAAVAVGAYWERENRFTLTGADGAFRLDGISAGSVALDARFPGRVTAKRENVTTGSEDADLVLAPVVPPLTALVTCADGRPAHRFLVTGYVRRVVEGQPDEIGRLRSTFVHAPDGRFVASESPWLGADVREIEVLCGDEVARVPVTRAEDGTADVRVALAPGGRIRGTISVPGGGSPGAVVLVLRAREGTWELPPNRGATADRNGRFEVGPLVPGPYLVTIVPDGLTFPHHVVAVVVRAGAITDVNETLAVGSVRLRVLDKDGAPVADAWPRLLDTDGAPAEFRTIADLTHRNPGKTGADGTLVIGGVDPGRYRVRLEGPAVGAASPPDADVEVRADATTDVEIRLPR